MPSLSDAQLLKLQAAIQEQDPASLLACLMVLLPTERSGHFVAALASLGKHDTDKAERLFRLAIELYDKYFPAEHSGGLSAMCGLARLLDEQKREAEIDAFLQQAYPLVLRAAKGIGKQFDEKAEGNGKAAALRILRNGAD